jgi:hypothetical protein
VCCHLFAFSCAAEKEDVQLLKQTWQLQLPLHAPNNKELACHVFKIVMGIAHAPQSSKGHRKTLDDDGPAPRHDLVQLAILKYYRTLQRKHKHIQTQTYGSELSRCKRARRLARVRPSAHTRRVTARVGSPLAHKLTQTLLSVCYLSV